jgi:hypothetical protein
MKLKLILPAAAILVTLVLLGFLLVLGHTAMPISQFAGIAIAAGIPWFFVGWLIDWAIGRFRQGREGKEKA